MARKKNPFGFPGMTAGGIAGGGLPTPRKPTRAALGGAVPRGGRMRMLPAIGNVGARGGIRVPKAAAPTARKRTSGATRRKKTV